MDLEMKIETIKVLGFPYCEDTPIDIGIDITCHLVSVYNFCTCTLCLAHVHS